MRTLLADLWDKLRTSLWFIPATMAGASVLLAFLLVRAQEWVIDDRMRETRWLATGDPDGARQILATIAGSIITVTGVIFSVTIVALSLASQQFGPRLLRNFMRNRSNQFVLGTFIGTFLYSILVLRVVQEHDDETQIPYLGVTFAVVLTIFALAMLIYFIHHAVVSIQADTVIMNVTRELHSTMKHVFPERGDVESESKAPADDERRDEDRATSITSSKTGYVRAIDKEGLTDVAEEHDVIIHVHARPGRFVIEGLGIARVHPGKPLDEAQLKDLMHHIRRGVLIGQSRASEQDIEYSIAQLVEIAVRSLSPSLNDPFTAMSCLDRLGEAIAELGQRELPKEQRCRRDGRLRLLIDRPNFEGMVNLAFDQIRQNAQGKCAVIIRMLEVIRLVLDRLADQPKCFEPLLKQARLIRSLAERSIEDKSDHDAVEERYVEVMSAGRTR